MSIVLPHVQQPFVLFWFRRDLRLSDNAGLYHALRSGFAVQPMFIFDTDILSKLEYRDDARVNFIHRCVVQLNEQLRSLGSSLLVFHGRPDEVFNDLLKQPMLRGLYANRDYEPYARSRDEGIHARFAHRGLFFKALKDHVVFEKDEVCKEDGSPYTVYTPYSKKWKARLSAFFTKPYPTEAYFHKLLTESNADIPTLESLGFSCSRISFPEPQLREEVIRSYHLHRDYPAADGTSRLSVHLRFGTLSIRQLVRFAADANEKWLNELIWREFYQSILWHFPHVAHQSFKPEYDRIQWRNNEEEFERWSEGKTGVPIVDAGMRELLTTGFMHNRVRMIVASFLVKDLLIDWRWGEAWFARHLLDFDLASNNGGWQWAAGCGVDAAPYFRVFNPRLQADKFDPQGEYVRKWVPEADSENYPQPMVDHSIAKARCLHVFRQALRG